MGASPSLVNSGRNQCTSMELARFCHQDVLLENVLQMQDDILGTGTSGAVRLALDGDGQKYAVKTFGKRNMCRELVQKEISIHASLDHPNIIRMLHVFESEENVQLVTEHMAGGELYSRIERGCLVEQEVAPLAFQILHAVSYLHKLKIIHRDLKLENILFKDEACTHVKVIDFGLATYWDGITGFNVRCGTPYYFAPEMWTELYTDKIDIWAIGLIIYEMLTGHAAFKGDKCSMMKSVKAGMVYYGTTFNRLCLQAQDFIRCLLSIDPVERPSAVEALRHPWLQGFSPSPPRSQSLCHGFPAQSSHDKHACFASIAAGLSCWELADLEEECHTMDKDRKGYISTSDFCRAMNWSLELEAHACEAVFCDLVAKKIKEVSIDEFMAVASQSRSCRQECMDLDVRNHVELDQAVLVSKRSCHSIESASTAISSEVDAASPLLMQRLAASSLASSTRFPSFAGASPRSAERGCFDTASRTPSCMAWFSNMLGFGV